jgi:anti-sigma regulatory factor (Ser/Thr protein kinase)
VIERGRCLEDHVRNDLLRLFRANPLLRDTEQVLATRLGRPAAAVRAALEALEIDGLVARRWVGQTDVYSFTGAPDDESKLPLSIRQPESTGPIPTLVARLRVPSSMGGVHTARSAAEALFRTVGLDAGAIVELSIAASEALTNAYRYGRRGDGKDEIYIDVRATKETVEVWVRDRGSGFPALLVGTSRGDIRSTGGRGIMLMRSLTDSMDIKRSGGGTVVRLVKRLAPANTSESTAAEAETSQ